LRRRDSAEAVPASRGTTFFFYGTLTDPPTLCRVLGRPLAADRLTPARLDGYRRVYLRGAPYPTLAPAPGAWTEGLLAQGIDPAMRAKLERYEGPLYRLIDVTVSPPGGDWIEALAFVARSAERISARPWSPPKTR
jgi:hypothetical protein